MKKIITTSWDDGSVHDVRIARLLKRYGLKGTFYIAPASHERKLLSDSQIREIDALGMEIGSHSLTHPRLTTLSRKRKKEEIEVSKQRLEDIVGRKVTSFCYPKGDYDAETVELVRRAGYTYARTTASFWLRNSGNPQAMHASVHFSRQPFTALLRHNLRIGNLSGIVHWASFGFEADPLSLAAKMAAVLRQKGGVMHLWGHGWEIEQYNMWKELEQAMSMVTKMDAVFLTNSNIVV